MSLYSDEQLKTEYFDPSIFIDKNRMIFNLSGHHLAYLPNMRITDLALTRSARDTKLNRLAGIYSLIKNARLLDGATELSALREANRFLGFKNQNQNRGYAMSVRNELVGSAIGFEYCGEDRKLRQAGYEPDGAGDTKANSGTFTIDLREVFPILKSISHLPTDLFRNLRVEIEFENLSTPALDIFVDANQDGSVQRPLLAVDYLDNPMIVKKMEPALKTLGWLEIEEDSFFVSREDATAGASQEKVQTANEKSMGFQNKHVERILIAKEIVDVQDGNGFLNGNIVRPAYGPVGSYACFREKLQVRLNGKNVLPREGLTQPNEMLSYLVDTWGDCALYPEANTTDVGIGMANVINEDGAVITAADDFRGAHSYFGLYLGEKIDDLQINYERTNLHDTRAIVRPTNENMRVHVYGEVKKALMVNGGKYNVVYV
jgi:hypothetical protein